MSTTLPSQWTHSRLVSVLGGEHWVRQNSSLVLSAWVTRPCTLASSDSCLTLPRPTPGPSACLDTTTDSEVRSRARAENMSPTAASSCECSLIKLVLLLTGMMKGVSARSGLASSSAHQGLSDLSGGWTRSSSRRYWPTFSR